LINELKEGNKKMAGTKNYNAYQEYHTALVNLEAEITKEKQNVQEILEEGESYGELDPRGEYDVLARKLVKEAKTQHVM
jgi:hypothetical protein